MYLSSPFNDKQVRVGGGLATPEHKKSGGYRYDIVPTGDKQYRAIANMDFVLFSPDYGSYAVYRITGTDLYVFFVHITSPKRGHVKRGEVFAKPYRKYWLHIHTKKGGYSPNIKNYIDWLYYLAPDVRVTVIPGVNPIYTTKPGKKQIKEPTGKFDFELNKRGHNLYMDNITAPYKGWTYQERLDDGVWVYTGKVYINTDKGFGGKNLGTISRQTKYRITLNKVAKIFDNSPQESENPCAKCEEEKEYLRKNLHECIKSKGELIKENEEYRKELDKYRTENKKLRKENTNLKIDINKLRNTVKQLETANRTLQGRLDKCRGDLEKCKEQISFIEKLFIFIKKFLQWLANPKKRK